jgi:hypothetical protein
VLLGIVQRLHWHPHAFAGPDGVSKPFARSSYESLFFKPAVFPLRHKKNPIAPKITSPPMTAPTAMPAFAPVERPLLLLLDSADCDAERLPVVEGIVPELAVGVGALKSLLVTLKQGTWMLKFIVSTKV